MAQPRIDRRRQPAKVAKPAKPKGKVDIYGRMVTPEMEKAAASADARITRQVKASLGQRAGKGGLQQTTSRPDSAAAKRLGFRE